MGKTNLTIKGTDFFINGKLTYSGIEGSHANTHGLLFNARFIQGVYNDVADTARYERFGFGPWDPDAQTGRLIAALPEWYAKGLRGFTVGMQGGGPVATIPNSTIDNNPFSADGLHIDPALLARLDRLITAADGIGMVVIVSFFYQAQAHHLDGAQAFINATKTASAWLKAQGYTNVIIEVANEHEVGNFKHHPIVFEQEGMVALLNIAREASGGMLVCSSGGGGVIHPQVLKASDIVMVHGNGLDRERYYRMIQRLQAMDLDKPIVCNEDSPCYSFVDIAAFTHTSWGYYNNMTKQEPPTYWGITPGEDTFFAWRMAHAIGIPQDDIPEAEQFYLQGLEEHETYQEQQFVRLASLYPEHIDYVDFYCDGDFVDRAYAEPFMVNSTTTWLQQPHVRQSADEAWKAVVHLKDGTERVVEG